MTPSIRIQDTNNSHSSEIVVQAVAAALYYTSLKGSPWDDELLPSED